MAGADRPSPKQRPGRTTVYRSRARAGHSDARAWVPFPDVDSLRTLEDLLDDDELVRSGQTQPVIDMAPASHVTPAEPEHVLARKRVHTRRARRRQRSRRRRRRIAFVAVAFLTIATVALHLPQLLRHSSQVTIRVDGATRVSAQTGAKSVAGALREQDVKVNADDRIRPRPKAKLTDGMTIEVFRSFQVDVDLDGVVTPVRTTWAKPARVLEQLRLDPDTVSIVAAPRRLTPGSAVGVRTLRRVSISVDGSQRTESTPALNVGEFLQQNGVALGPEDEVSASPDTGLADGMTVTVARIVKDTETNDEPLAPPTVTQDDPATPVGQQGVVQEGVPGMQRVVYEITKRDGQEVGRVPISSELVQPATPTIVAIGSAPASVPPG
jgi:uncharacterized protein YabE (DUF348 family)